MGDKQQQPIQAPIQAPIQPVQVSMDEGWWWGWKWMAGLIVFAAILLAMYFAFKGVNNHGHPVNAIQESFSTPTTPVTPPKISTNENSAHQIQTLQSQIDNLTKEMSLLKDNKKSDTEKYDLVYHREFC